MGSRCMQPAIREGTGVLCRNGMQQCPGCVDPTPSLHARVETPPYGAVHQTSSHYAIWFLSTNNDSRCNNCVINSNRELKRRRTGQ